MCMHAIPPPDGSTISKTLQRVVDRMKVDLGQDHMTCLEIGLPRRWFDLLRNSQEVDKRMTVVDDVVIHYQHGPTTIVLRRLDR